jgi:hypothetical protein
MTAALTPQQIYGIVDDDLARVRAELPEIDLLADPSDQERVAGVWASFLKVSSYDSIRAAPAFPGLPAYHLAGHTRQVVRNSLALAESMTDFWGIDYDREALVAAALTHDASKLVEREGPDGRESEVGGALLHAQLAGVRCLEFGLSPKVAYLVTYHPFTPPHIHVKPKYNEFVILSWADICAADTVFFHEGKPTHLDFEKRFFTLE